MQKIFSEINGVNKNKKKFLRSNSSTFVKNAPLVEYMKMNLNFLRQVFPNESGTLSLHDLAFSPMFNLHATKEQKEKWLHRIQNYEIIGNYAQTELGHGG